MAVGDLETDEDGEMEIGEDGVMETDVDQDGDVDGVEGLDGDNGDSPDKQSDLIVRSSISFLF